MREERRKHRRCGSADLYVWILLIGLLSIPFLSVAQAVKNPIAYQEDKEIFGVDAEVVKAIFYGMLIVAVWLIKRTLSKIDKSQSALHANDKVLFDNQRKIVTALSAITTAHTINHPGQPLRTPDLVDSSFSREEGEE